MKKRSRRIKPAVDRETVYLFAETPRSMPVAPNAPQRRICFEWLQRPGKSSDGTWSGYSPPEHPGWVRIREQILAHYQAQSVHI